MFRLTMLFLAAPVLGSAIGALLMTPFVPMSEGLVAFVIGFGMVGAAIAQIFTIVVGLPAFLILRSGGRLKWTYWYPIALLAAVAAVLVVQFSLVLVNKSWPEASPWPDPFVVVFATTCSLVTAAIIWRLRDQSNSV
jgi:phosphoglycerol transferase MdoB-like AlkP superfamily enzyme